MEKIAVAVDFDEEMDDVLNRAADLAEISGAELHVVHIYPPIPNIARTPYIYPDVAFVQTEEEHEGSLQSQKKSIQKMVSDLHQRGLKAHGFMKPVEDNVANEILEFADEKETDLLVIGIHRMGRLERLVIGSITEEVIRKSTIPVLVVPRLES